MNLGEFLREGGSRKREANVWDCSTFPSLWAVACGHADPMRDWYGAYSTEEEAEAFIYEAGGLLPLFAKGFDGAGVPRKKKGAPLLPGDVGVLNFLDLESGAVYTGKKWAFVADKGLAFIDFPESKIEAVWRPTRG